MSEKRETKSIRIGTVGDHSAVNLAATELKRYLSEAGAGDATMVDLAADAEGAGDNRDATFVLGVAADLDIDLPEGIDPVEDDWISIQPTGAGYTLTGSNPRSVLFAAYRYLVALGYRWVRPGERGQLTPTVNDPLVGGLRVDERASYRYRTICIEGACSKQHVLDLLDWQTKQGMNGYFIQFEYSADFFERWHQHAGNPHWEDGQVTREQIIADVEAIIVEIKRRGLRFERVGHGWTCKALGVEGEGWHASDLTLAPEKQEWLAKIDGKHDWFGGVPLNTNLNFGRADVRDAVTDEIAAYAAAHPEVDLLHFWLADGMNNTCESEESQQARPSDFYVDMANELDAKLAERGLTTRIVLLIYVDLLWPPEQRRINNPERFILMFAPITRSYKKSFLDALKEKSSEMKPFVRNKLEMPKSIGENLTYLRAWRDQFKGDGFDFDYHNIWACYYDPNQYAIAKVLHADIQGLDRISLQGLNSCQNQRASFPHNLMMDVMAWTLWNKDLTFEEIAESSFAAAYGDDASVAHGFFREMSALWDPMFDAVYIPEPDEERIEASKANLPRIREKVSGMRSIVGRNLDRTQDAVFWSWWYLGQHLDLMEQLLPAFAAYLDRSPETGEKFDAVFDWLWRREKDLHPALDVYEMVKVFKWRVNEASNAGEPTGIGG